jgi:hypothetical protein
LAFPGGGIFFYWQAGVVTYLRQLSQQSQSQSHKYDLTQCSATGASAGALTATLTACDVDFYQATELALQMADEAGVWKRSRGLQGIWGPLIRQWLDDLLPDDAAQRMEARHTTLLVTTPFHTVNATKAMSSSRGNGNDRNGILQVFPKQAISTFYNRQDVIDCNMASVHLPIFLDGQWTANFRQQACIDGSFLATRNDYLAPPPPAAAAVAAPPTLFLSHRQDERYQQQSIFSFVQAATPDGIYQMIEDGKAYAKRLEEQGVLQSLLVEP